MGAISDLGHRLGRQVVAEGVESEEAWRRLRFLGCDSAQGFWICRPVPAEEIPAFVRGWRGGRPDAVVAESA